MSLCIIAAFMFVFHVRFLPERYNFIAMSGYCHDMLSVYRLSVVTRVDCDKTAEVVVMPFSLKCSPMP